MALTCSGSISRNDIDDSSGKSSLFGQLSHVQPCQRSLLGQLHDHAVSSGQGRSKLPGLHQQWEIPGNNLATNAHGFMTGVSEEVAINGYGFSVVFIGPTRVVPKQPIK